MVSKLKQADSIYDVMDVKGNMGVSTDDQTGASFARHLDIIPLPAVLRTGMAQNLIVGLICFCCPGLFNALQGLGGAGQDDTQITAAMNSALYGCFAIFGYFGGLLFNIFGNKILLAFGGLTYAFYAVSTYLYGNDASYAGMAIVASALLGVGAGMLWTAQGAMTLSYSTENQKGTFTAVFWIIFNLGGVFGGILTFFMNRGNGDGTISAATYYTFCGLMVLGAVLALLLVVHPTKVVRSDGTTVKFEKAASPKQEIKTVAMMFANKYMLLMTPLIIQSNWFYAYDFGMNTVVFDVETRGINSALFWGMQMVGAYLLGACFLDSKNMGRRRRAVLGLMLVGTFNLAQWGYAAWYQFTYKYDKETPAEPRVNYTDGSEYWVPAGLFMCMGFADALIQTYAYWIIGAISNSPRVLAGYAGYYKGVQSLGACISWLIDFKSVPLQWQMVICIVLAVVMLPPTFVVANMVKETSNVENDSDLAIAKPKKEQDA